MECERNENGQRSVGGLSRGKLRNMLFGIERKRKQPQEETESTFSLRSQVSEIDDSGDCCSEIFKDVNIVSVLPDCSTSTTADSLAMELISGAKPKDQSLVNSRTRSQDEGPIFGADRLIVSSPVLSSPVLSSPVFEFQKSEKAAHRMPIGPFSKPAPSKWDDAQKWIASPIAANRPKNMQGGQGAGSRKTSNVGYGSRQPSMKVVVEVPDQKLVPLEEPDTKRIDLNQAKKDNVAQKFVSLEVDPYYKPELLTDSFGESATTFVPPPSTARSVSMRDMGTEMTPITSQDPSRTGTPVRATTPMRSPNSSHPSTPGRSGPDSSPTPLDHVDPKRKELSEKELQMKTRREIMALGTQLGKLNIAAWASKEEEDKDASTSLKTVKVEESAKCLIETRAAAWEDAEKAKYMARFKSEEMKIQAWENHQKAKTEAEMRKIEVEVEQMRGRAHDRLMNKLAAARHKAEEKREAAETKRNHQAAKTEQQAEYIRKTGRVPSFSCCGWCL